jgi:hypothetical protein
MYDILTQTLASFPVNLSGHTTSLRGYQHLPFHAIHIPRKFKNYNISHLQVLTFVPYSVILLFSVI